MSSDFPSQRPMGGKDTHHRATRVRDRLCRTACLLITPMGPEFGFCVPGEIVPCSTYAVAPEDSK